jgi:tetratricopeptide (TPR) repeat protein
MTPMLEVAKSYVEDAKTQRNAFEQESNYLIRIGHTEKVLSLLEEAEEAVEEAVSSSPSDEVVTVRAIIAFQRGLTWHSIASACEDGPAKYNEDRFDGTMRDSILKGRAEHSHAIMEALKNFQMAVAFDPSDAVIWFNVGVLLEHGSYGKHVDLSAAEAAFKKVLELAASPELITKATKHLFEMRKALKAERERKDREQEEESRRAEAARRMEEERKAEEARRAETIRRMKEERKAEEARQAEAHRVAEARREEEARNVQEEARKEAEARLLRRNKGIAEYRRLASGTDQSTHDELKQLRKRRSITGCCEVCGDEQIQMSNRGLASMSAPQLCKECQQEEEGQTLQREEEEGQTLQRAHLKKQFQVRVGLGAVALLAISALLVRWTGPDMTETEKPRPESKPVSRTVDGVPNTENLRAVSGRLSAVGGGYGAPSPAIQRVADPTVKQPTQPTSPIQPDHATPKQSEGSHSTVPPGEDGVELSQDGPNALALLHNEEHDDAAWTLIRKAEASGISVRDRARACNDRGFRLLNENNAPERALPFLEYAAKVDPTYGMPRYSAAKCHAAKGNTDGVLQYLGELKAMGKGQQKRLMAAQTDPAFASVANDPRFTSLFQ